MKPERGEGVVVMMKHVLLIAVIAACGSKQSPAVSNAGGSGDGSATPPVVDSRTEIQRRRDVACETLGPRITSCALEDAKAQLAANKISQKAFNDTTQSAVLAKNTAEFIDKCKAEDFSSRQVRVLEVCQHEESQCEPLLACLDNLNEPSK